MAEARHSRRAVVALAAFGGAIVWGGVARAQACFDRKSLPQSDLSLRRSLGFKDTAPDPKRACGGCAFFTAAKPATCGKCTLMSGGPVAATSVCDSWAARR